MKVVSTTKMLESKDTLDSNTSSSSSKRHILRQKYLTQNQPNPRISNTYQYFLKSVDPIFGELITKILLHQPNDINKFLVKYFKSIKDNKPFIWSETNVNLSKDNLKLDHKLYFKEYVSPIVTKLIKDVAVKKPANISEFLYTECCNLPPAKFPAALTTSTVSESIPSSISSTKPNENNIIHDANENHHTTDTTNIPNNNNNKKESSRISPRKDDKSSPRKEEFRPQSSHSIRSKFDDAKSLADSITNSSDNLSVSARQSISRNKLENAINYEVMIQNNPSMNALRESISSIDINQQPIQQSSQPHLNESLSSKPIPVSLSAEQPIVSSQPLNENSIIAQTTTTDIPISTVTIPSETIPIKKSIQIALLGLGNSGKTTMINTMQSIIKVPKPTVGFRPVSLELENAKVQFYDLGGSEKIRGIWTQYYHDTHGLVYVIDISSIVNNEVEREKALTTLHQVVSHEHCRHKPLLIFLNKIDLLQNNNNNNLNNTGNPEIVNNNTSTNTSPDDITTINTTITNDKLSSNHINPEIVIEEFKKSIYDKLFDITNTIHIIECSSLPKSTESHIMREENSIEDESITLIPQFDNNIELYIEKIIHSINNQYDIINDRVQNDILIKLKEDTLKRVEREKRVLKTKMALAFYENLDIKILVELFTNNNKEEELDMKVFQGNRDILTETEGIEFLASELTDDNGPGKLPPIALKIIALVGYQRLALQIIGGFVKPTNKKRVPLTWEEVYDMIIELRSQLGITNEIITNETIIEQ